MLILFAVTVWPAARFDDTATAAPPKNDEFAATVLTSDGALAARAEVALAIAGSQVMVKNGELSWTAGAPRCRTDAAGRFHFPRQADDFWLVITHPLGYLRVKCFAKSLPATFKLNAWARAEGTLRTARQLQPHVGIRIDHDLTQHAANDALIFFSETGTTDGQGRFVLERVLPGRGTIGKELARTQEGASLSSSRRVRIRFDAGKTTRIDLGNSGRPVIG
ncbi:MAG TPA: hypothetical protein VEI07_12675, partial [Planctomycetaceae bacterium]|nr:hypothetical protein [Planctomycetaceae bacterium]